MTDRNDVKLARANTKRQTAGIMLMHLSANPFTKFADLQRLEHIVRGTRKDRNSGFNRKRNYNNMATKRASKAKHNRLVRGC